MNIQDATRALTQQVPCECFMPSHGWWVRCTLLQVDQESCCVTVSLDDLQLGNTPTHVLRGEEVLSQRLRFSDDKSITLPPEASLWDVYRRIGGPTSYFLAILDGQTRIPCILLYDKNTHEIQVEPYIPQDYDYTLHDGCDHESGDCIENSPSFQEQEWHDTNLLIAYNRLEREQQDLRQRKIAERLLEQQEQEQE